MRVKVGNEWFSCSGETPIQVELTEKDKQNIANMAPGATLYAVFAEPARTEFERGQQMAWMLEGSNKQGAIISVEEAEKATHVD
ncbi:hypothetical protein F406_gp020 [Agrobacterium phage 7-7-1]|uniref:Uncharacterized protein n=1 Tax=Agrobacterium phage 7-7-1 TaxID=1161931 RepID=J7F8Z2_9CAUD|nr:hypothetical protein F406_gp020 [Agrobacterium phage 7-7-1]AFH19795.1 hypothetical protein 7-7-1_00097 [Agrobacterium phage 7-7-1]